VRSAAWLGPEAREIVHHLKYEGYTALGRPVAELIARAVPRPAHSVLVPVPLGPGRERDRGYNQAAVIARALGTVWSVPVAESLLRRVRDTRSQTALTPEERRSNVARAFAAASLPSHRGRRSGAAVILVDDVLTTGATLAASAAALATAGWSELGAVTFARALPFELRADGTVEHDRIANQGT
jgi:ComF family protein